MPQKVDLLGFWEWLSLHSFIFFPVSFFCFSIYASMLINAFKVWLGQFIQVQSHYDTQCDSAWNGDVKKTNKQTKKQKQIYNPFLLAWKEDVGILFTAYHANHMADEKEDKAINPRRYDPW